MVQQRNHVVVIGGGYSGAMAANRLRRRKHVDITLVNPRREFVEKLRLHQLAAGTHQALVDYAKVLGRGVCLVVDTAERIDAATRSVQLVSGRTLDYDFLVYAVGSTGEPPVTIPGAAEHAHSISELEYARELRSTLAKLPATAPITVVGGGFTGIEMSGELGEQGRVVRLVCGGTLATGFSDAARGALREQLARVGVDVTEGPRVTEVRAGSVVLDDGTVLTSTVTIWAGGFGVPDLARASGLATDALGRLLTDETLTSVDERRVVGGGDAVAPSGQPLRMACQTAIPLGAMAAQTVLSRIAGEQPSDIDLGYLGSCVSVGPHLATLQLTERDDIPTARYLSGRTAAVVKRVGLAAVSGVKVEGRLAGSARWPTGGRHALTAPAGAHEHR